MKKWFLRTSLAKLVLLFGCPIIIFFNFLLLTLSTPDQDNLSLFTTSAPSLRSPPVLTEGPPALVPPKDVPGAFISIHDSSQCLDTMGHNRASQKAGMFACHYKGGTQSWTWSSKYGALRNEMMNLCLCKELILCDCEKNIWPIQEVAPHVLFGLSYVPKLNRNPMSKYDFNERVSAAIGPYRASYPDLRHKTCKNQKRANLRAPMLTTTIIICFVDEEYNTLLRTIYSVLTRSPSNLLDEIILVDDGSTDPRLLNELPIYIERHLPRVRLVRTHARTLCFSLSPFTHTHTHHVGLLERCSEPVDLYHQQLPHTLTYKTILLINLTGTGLIRARVRGVSEASSPTVTFLDSHVEVGDGWLSPLMERLSDSSRPRLIVCPVITVINQNTLKPQTTLDHGNTAYGVFDWKLIFHWKYHRKDPAPSIRGSPPKSPSDPVESPTMAGGLFSMRVQDFYDMGTYDEGMEGWGGENLELSFRAWMCGGSIEIVPCSLVGHIFRKKNPTKFETGSVSDLFRKNLKRVAEVWMDDYKDLFYTRYVSLFEHTKNNDRSFSVLFFFFCFLLPLKPNPKKKLLNKFILSRNRRAKSEMNYGDVSKRVQLRNRLKCQSFQWYMDTLVPNMFQAFERNIRAGGTLFLSVSFVNYFSLSPSLPPSFFSCSIIHTHATSPTKQQVR
jgi:glycosyltransferase involved in cell wall biosynthesis